MFAVIYSFTIKPERAAQFINAWKEMTQLIKAFEGGLGSRLHKKSETEYIAYAQWPSREKWKNAGGNLPKEAELVSQAMRECCIESKTIHELEMLEDLLEYDLLKQD